MGAVISFPKNKYHYKSRVQPVLYSHFNHWGIRRSVWAVETRARRAGVFVSWWFFSKLQIYHGQAKCDGSESAPLQGIYDYTDKPSELRAFRWRRDGPHLLAWKDMGGS